MADAPGDGQAVVEQLRQRIEILHEHLAIYVGVATLEAISTAAAGAIGVEPAASAGDDAFVAPAAAAAGEEEHGREGEAQSRGQVYRSPETGRP